MKLDNMFMASLVADLLKGMIYIHSTEIGSHGNLKSSNCVVDNRWVLQITDYGLEEFKRGAKEDEDLGEYAKLRGRYNCIVTINLIKAEIANDNAGSNCKND